jgi:putative glutathione S-transferase
VGRLQDGRWLTDDLGADAEGNFVRRQALFRGRIENRADAEHPAQSGRYHLYFAHACGWSHRTQILLAQKGLNHAISSTHVHPFMGEMGWSFDGGQDPILGKRYLHEVYVEADPRYSGRASVPLLWDKQKGTIVTNESRDIVACLDSEMEAFATNSFRFFDHSRKDEIESMVAANYEAVNNGVYKCGFANSQAAHEGASRALFARLDELELLLSDQRYLLGETITAADWYLFPTLIRFDTIYYVHFKCCLRQLRDYPCLWAYTRDLYQQPGVAATCDFDSMREHYYTSHETIHPRRYIPIGPQVNFDEPHGREGLST